MIKQTTFEERCNIVSQITNGEYVVAERIYDNKKYQEKLKIKHVLCGTEFIAAFASFQKGRRCPHCTDSPIFHTHETIAKVYADCGYTLLSHYTKQRDKARWVCPLGHKGESTYDSFLHGHRCNECAIEARAAKRRGRPEPRFQGPNNPAWKGGSSSVRDTLRAEITGWKYRVLEQWNRTCCLTGKKTKKIQVHHVDSFDIVLKAVNTHIGLDNYSGATDEIMERVKYFSRHYHNPNVHDCLVGVPLHKDIHKLFHKIYGFGDNTRVQFKEFVIKCIEGEFDAYFKENNLQIAPYPKLYEELGIVI